MKNFKLILLLIILVSQKLFGLDPKELAGSMTLINPIKKDLLREDLRSKDHPEWLISPVLGAKLWESRTIWNIYKFLPNQDSLALLTKSLFNENQGVFLESTLPKNMAYHLNIEILGYLVAALLRGLSREDFIEYFEKNETIQRSKEEVKKIQQEYKNELIKQKKVRTHFSKSLKNVLNPNLDLSTNDRLKSYLKDRDLSETNKIVNRFIVNNYVKFIQILNINVGKIFGTDVDYFTLERQKPVEYLKQVKPIVDQAIKNHFRSLNRYQKKHINKFKGQIKAARKILEIINIDGFLEEYLKARSVIKRIKKLEKLISNTNISSEMESDFIDNLIYSGESNSFYPKNMNLMVLLAFLYKKVNNKVDMIQYFSAVAKHLNISLDDLINSNKFKKTIFDKNYKEVLSNFKSKEVLCNFKSYEDLLIAQIMFYFISGLPKIVTYKDSVVYGTTNFPDCMETALRNLFNMNFFTEGKFLVPSYASDELKEFYELQTPLNVSDSNIHSNWVNLVADKGYTFYLQVGLKGRERESLQKACLLLPKGHNINLDDFELDEEKVEFYGENFIFKTIKLYDENFLLIDKNDEKFSNFVCFELYPCLSNIIIFFNDFLNLNLIDFSSYFLDDSGLLSLFNYIFDEKTSFDEIVLVDKNNNILDENIGFFDSSIFKIKKEENFFNLEIINGSHAEIPYKDIIEPKLEIRRKSLETFFSDLIQSNSVLDFSLIAGSLDLDFFIRKGSPVIGLLLLNFLREDSRFNFLKSIISRNGLTDSHFMFIKKILYSFDIDSDSLKKIIKYSESLKLDKRIKAFLDEKVQLFIIKSLNRNDPDIISSLLEFSIYFYKNVDLRKKIWNFLFNFLIEHPYQKEKFKQIVDYFCEIDDLEIKRELLFSINRMVRGFINQNVSFIDIEFIVGLYKTIFAINIDLELSNEFKKTFNLALNCLDFKNLNYLGKRILEVLNNYDKKNWLELIRSRRHYSIKLAHILLDFKFKYLDNYKKTILYKKLVDMDIDYAKALYFFIYNCNQSDPDYNELLSSIITKSKSNPNFLLGLKKILIDNFRYGKLDVLAEDNLLFIFKRLFGLNLGFDIAARLLGDISDKIYQLSRSNIVLDKRYISLALLLIEFDKDLKSCLRFFIHILYRRENSPLILKGLELLLEQGVGLKEIILLSITTKNRRMRLNLNKILDQYKSTEKYERILSQLNLSAEDIWKMEHPIFGAFKRISNSINDTVLRRTHKHIKEMYNY